MKLTDFLLVSNISRMQELLILSIVGTMMSENLVSGVMVNSGHPINQFFQQTWKKNTNIHKYAVSYKYTLNSTSSLT